MKYCAVLHKNYREIGRSNPLPWELAYRLVQRINRESGDHTWNAASAYVEEAGSVKHLPVIYQDK